MRSILLHIRDDDCLEARLQVAIDLARGFDGHLTCVQALPVTLGMPGDLYGMADQLLPDIRASANALCQRLKARLAIEGVAWNWIQEDGLAAEHLLRRCGLSDVAVLGSCDPLGKGPSRLVGDVVLRAETPIMIVPPEIDHLDCSGSAVVAWDGSLEASRALRGALPLLRKASAVVLVTISGASGDTSIGLPPTDGAEYLSRHGIACDMRELPVTDGSVSWTLVTAAAEAEASYLVMGAYGHARLLETVFGGVTRELFAAPPVPILACH